jgi:hypothetical protein
MLWVWAVLSLAIRAWRKNGNAILQQTIIAKE